MARNSVKEKNTIFYARDYRHFSADKRKTLLSILLVVLPTAAIFTIYYSPITHALSYWAGWIAADVTNETVELWTTPFIPWFGGVYYYSLPGHAPSFTHALIVGILSIAGLIIVGQIRPNSKPLMIYICMALYIQLISCVYFIFWPEYFPYTIIDYSQLYMVQTAALLIILPTIFGFAISLLRLRFIERVAAMLVQIFIQFLYNLTRYVLYMTVLHYFSYLYMATLFFSLGVLFDFIQMVTIYGYIAKKVSEYYKTPEGSSEWAWS